MKARCCCARDSGAWRAAVPSSGAAGGEVVSGEACLACEAPMEAPSDGGSGAVRLGGVGAAPAPRDASHAGCPQGACALWLTKASFRLASSALSIFRCRARACACAVRSIASFRSSCALCCARSDWSASSAATALAVSSSSRRLASCECRFALRAVSVRSCCSPADWSCANWRCSCSCA